MGGHLAHSNRLLIHSILVGLEIIVFIGAVATAYLSENHDWAWFLTVSIILIVIFSILKIIDTFPTIREMLVRKSAAAKIDEAAVQYGVEQYFNMQSQKGQNERNEAVKYDIEQAGTMWLCANSGASYLDQNVYRHWPHIKKKLEEGIDFRCVLLAPNSAENLFRNTLNSDGGASDSKLDLVNIIRLMNKYPNLEIRFAEHGMHMTVFASEKMLFLDPYHVGIHDGHIDNRNFCLRIIPIHPSEGRGLYQIYKSHFDTLWQHGVQLEVWLATNREVLPHTLPRLQRILRT
jgi:hypothetical protein